eukprot:gene1847-2785_t
MCQGNGEEFAAANTLADCQAACESEATCRHVFYSGTTSTCYWAPSCTHLSLNGYDLYDMACPTQVPTAAT